MNFDIQRFLIESPFLAIFIVFIAGSIASLSSCTLVRIPVVFSYIVGYSNSRRRAIFLLIFFVLGLILSYTVLGILLGIAGNFASKLITTSKYIFWVLGGLLIIAGIFLSGLFRLRSLHFHVHISEKFKNTNLFGAFVFGIVLALLEMPSCPCCAPVLLIIASTVFVSGSYLYAILVFISFAIGQSIPTLLIGTSTALVKYLTPRIQKFETYIRLVAGNILIIIGVYFVIIA
jgi:cytochrome c biogenesis protein CcdA